MFTLLSVHAHADFLQEAFEDRTITLTAADKAAL
jgi:hypothetical protein